MKEAEVLAMVQREVKAIFERDGRLDKGAYLWAEVATRLSTLKPWEGLRTGESVGRGLRPLVEAVASGPQFQKAGPDLPQHLAPTEAAHALGAKKQRHLRGPRDQPAPC